MMFSIDTFMYGFTFGCAGFLIWRFLLSLSFRDLLPPLPPPTWVVPVPYRATKTPQRRNAYVPHPGAATWTQLLDCLDKAETPLTAKEVKVASGSNTAHIFLPVMARAGVIRRLRASRTITEGRSPSYVYAANFPHKSLKEV